ncbi:Rieske (2Fe-2S) protein [Nocardioides daphniae]|uniref:Cytochrome bc1 complex Rieske iron-sulfur subunit n=1 Tax=Nocardioides daphniae TaxID=402297 RepID=A0A4P7UEG5_9ACTN|nr:Rieske (2Fe-2S) protein [Nocardioides daphniae]QCC78693.1 Rieske (2Fe-2S) protein [Nocardioides daphniae]GGD26238.1 iron-sulfur protein [Nocardioides daphniae]
MSNNRPSSHLLSRRSVLASGATAAAVPMVAGCGEDEPVTAPEPPKADTELLKTSDVPVGGCAVVSALKLVVTQPSEGQFKAFSSLCTHQGCEVSSSSDGEIPCTCHGSRFSLTDGSVIKGPAEVPLEEVAVEVKDGVVTTTNA